MLDLAYLNGQPQVLARVKAEYADFVVQEDLGYEIAGEGEFVALYVRKTDCNTLFVGEQLAKFAGISARNMSYAGLKDRRAVTEQWFCLHLAGKETPDFSQFQLEGVEILKVSRHNRKIRVGSLKGNFFDILLRDVEHNSDLETRLNQIQHIGFPNYFTEQRFGRDGHNLTQAVRWANGEIKVKDRKKRSFYLSAARSEVFNLVVNERLKQGVENTILPQDILQLNGSHSWFIADDAQDFSLLQQRLAQQDILLTAPLIGGNEVQASELENQIVAQHQALLKLMKQEELKAARRPILLRPQQMSWQFEPLGLRLKFWLPTGSYATALIRELALINEENF